MFPCHTGQHLQNMMQMLRPLYRKHFDPLHKEYSFCYADISKICNVNHSHVARQHVKTVAYHYQHINTVAFRTGNMCCFISVNF